MKGFLAAISAVAVLTTIGWPATAQNQGEASSQLVERTVTALPNRDTQIGIYVNVRPDCSSGPLPTIRLASPPSSGNVVVKNGKVKATNYKACLALEVPAERTAPSAERSPSVDPADGGGKPDLGTRTHRQRVETKAGPAGFASNRPVPNKILRMRMGKRRRTSSPARCQRSNVWTAKR